MKLLELLTKKRMWLCVIYSYERHLHLRFDPIKLKITCFSHSKFELMGGHSRNNLPQYKQKPNEHSMNACSSGECHTVWLVDSPAFFLLHQSLNQLLVLAKARAFNAAVSASIRNLITTPQKLAVALSIRSGFTSNTLMRVFMWCICIGVRPDFICVLYMSCACVMYRRTYIGNLRFAFMLELEIMFARW